MKIKSIFLLLTVAALTITMAIPVQAAQERSSDEMTRIQDAMGVLQESKGEADAAPRALMRNAAAVAIVPNMMKGAFIVGAERGSGVLLVQEERGQWSDPIFISVTGASFGAQIGVESTDVVMVFNNQKGINSLLDGELKLGADVTVAAGELDAKAGMDTSQDVITYKRSGGAFAGASLSGAVVQVEDSANRDFYGSEDLTGKQILAGLDLDVPDHSERLKDALKRYIGRE